MLDWQISTLLYRRCASQFTCSICLPVMINYYQGGHTTNCSICLSVMMTNNSQSLFYTWWYLHMFPYVMFFFPSVNGFFWVMLWLASILLIALLFPFFSTITGISQTNEDLDHLCDSCSSRGTSSCFHPIEIYVAMMCSISCVAICNTGGFLVAVIY